MGKLILVRYAWLKRKHQGFGTLYKLLSLALTLNHFRHNAEFLERVENMGNGENAGYPTLFLKDSFTMVVIPGFFSKG